MKKRLVAWGLNKFFVLHARPFQETSLLLDCLTESEGYMTLLAKGVKRGKSNRVAVLQPFQMLLGQWRGKSELKVIYDAELAAEAKRLQGKTLYTGLYVNELLVKVLHKHDPCPDIFHLYATLMQSPLDAVSLRCFEKALLEALGYALQMTHDAEHHHPLLPEKNYRFTREHGFIALDQVAFAEAKQSIFLGRHLLAIAKNDYREQAVASDAKRLMRLAFMPLLGDQPLKIREIVGGKDAVRSH